MGSRDKTHKLSAGEEITVSGPGAQGRISLNIYDLTIRFTKAQAKRLGADLVRRASR